MRLVLCDDHLLFLDALAVTLTERGHHVVAALPGADGVAEAVELGDVDCVILDLNLGGESGLCLAETVRARCPGVPVLLLSASADPAAWAAYDAGVIDGLVSKGCATDVLERAIRKLRVGDRIVEGWLRVPEQRRASTEEPLTDREREVLRLIVDGATTSAISSALGVSNNTVRTHVQNVMRKLQVHHRTMAAQRAIELGMAG